MADNWALMIGGDKDAFMRIYKSEYQPLFSYGFSLTADREMTKDCIQELFLELWNKRSTQAKDVKNIRSYLFTWLRRKISHEFMLKKRQSDSGMQDGEMMQLSYEELLISFQQSEEKKATLHSALKKLTKQQLEMIRLKFFEDLSYRSIAEQTALTPRTVYNLIYEALKNLRQSIKLVFFQILY